MDDQKNLILQLVDHALKDDHTNFEKLRSFNAFMTARLTSKSIKKVVETLEFSTHKLFSKYCKAVIQHQADITLLLAYRQLKEATEYYQQELDNINETLADYKNYLFEGNFIKAFLFNKERD